MDGLRIDVAHALFKADGPPDSPSTGGVVDGLRSNPQVSDQEDVHEVYRSVCFVTVPDSVGNTRCAITCGCSQRSERP